MKRFTALLALGAGLILLALASSWRIHRGSVAGPEAEPGASQTAPGSNGLTPSPAGSAGSAESGGLASGPSGSDDEAADPGTTPEVAAGPRSSAPNAGAGPRIRRPSLGIAKRLRPDGVEPVRGPKMSPAFKQNGIDAWKRHIAPLTYPEGHPLAGQYRDSVGIDQAVDAQVDYWREMLPEGHLDQPILYFEKSIDIRALNERIKSWDRADPASGRAFYEWLLEQPEKPGAYPTRLEIPVDADDPDAFPRAELVRRNIRRVEQQIFGEE
jgi:hypothetical protein